MAWAPPPTCDLELLDAVLDLDTRTSSPTTTTTTTTTSPLDPQVELGGGAPLPTGDVTRQGARGTWRQGRRQGPRKLHLWTLPLLPLLLLLLPLLLLPLPPCNP